MDKNNFVPYKNNQARFFMNEFFCVHHRKRAENRSIQKIFYDLFPVYRYQQVSINILGFPKDVQAYKYIEYNTEEATGQIVINALFI